MPPSGYTQTLPILLAETVTSTRTGKVELGQFMTSRKIADFMSSLFSKRAYETASLLDAGAGKGTLSASFIDSWYDGDLKIDHLKVTTFEIDPGMCASLTQSLRRYKEVPNLEIQMVFSDFIEHSVQLIQNGNLEPYSHCILNPPYKKINSASQHRSVLRKIGIEAVNLYSAFLSLCLLMLESSGELVAIIPRSFCNGTYYLPFRKLILENASIRQIHLFNARDKAFKSDGVLQENVIIHLERNAVQGEVTISTSTDDQFADYSSLNFPFEKIVQTTDDNLYFHIPTDESLSPLTESPKLKFKLSDLGLGVCTGPVVDFRATQFLRMKPGADCVPLLYPFHFAKYFAWPRTHSRKPNALQISPETAKMLLPNGFYVVLKRFSSKEENRRIVAYLVRPDYFTSEYLAFENHLNVIHFNKHGMGQDLARGLEIYLNSSFVDSYFRRFSGHTQVNATDLRILNFPSQESLMKLGHSNAETRLNAQEIDSAVSKII